MIRIIFLKLPWLLSGEWITEGRSGKLRARVGPAEPCRQRSGGQRSASFLALPQTPPVPMAYPALHLW